MEHVEIIKEFARSTKSVKAGNANRHACVTVDLAKKYTDLQSVYRTPVYTGKVKIRKRIVN